MKLFNVTRHTVIVYSITATTANNDILDGDNIDIIELRNNSTSDDVSCVEDNNLYRVLLMRRAAWSPN
jgi:hypothetical protein